MDVSFGNQSFTVNADWARTEAPAAPAARPRADRHRGDRLFYRTVAVAAGGLVALLASIGIFLAWGAWPTVKRFGFSFLTTSTWDPVRDVYGALPVIFGTVVSSLLAMAIATPVSIGIALYLNEMAPRRLGRIVGFLVEMLAAIPSVVFGLWGIFALAPWLRSTVQPLLGKTLGFLPLFQGPPFGVGMMAAGLILAIMVIPTVSSISREVFRAIPRAQREAAWALGATRWETMRIAVLASAKTGLFGAVILGLGRAIGETMAVTMVIGNRADISASLFAPAQTMASVLANEYAEATSDAHLSALIAVGLALFGVTFVINAAARFILWRVVRKAGTP